MRSATDAVISATTRAERINSVLRLLPARAPSRSPSLSVRRPNRSAGITPNATPVTTVSAAAMSRRRRSSAGTSAIGNAFGTRRAASGSVTNAMATPRTPPHADSNRLSVIICRTRRSGAAPIATRTANSCRRASARASRRLATLATAMISTQIDATTSASSNCRDCQLTSSRSQTAVALVRSFASGKARARRAAINASSLRAA